MENNYLVYLTNFTLDVGFAGENMLVINDEIYNKKKYLN